MSLSEGVCLGFNRFSELMKGRVKANVKLLLFEVIVAGSEFTVIGPRALLKKSSCFMCLQSNELLLLHNKSRPVVHKLNVIHVNQQQQERFGLPLQ